MKKVVHLTIAALMALCMILQINDPDPWIWMAAYLVVLVLALNHALDWQLDSSFIMLIAILFLVGLAAFVPDVVVWIREGTPTIVGDMKAESPHIELVREAGGLLICTVLSCYYWLRARSATKS